MTDIERIEKVLSILNAHISAYESSDDEHVINTMITLTWVRNILSSPALIDYWMQRIDGEGILL